MRKIETYLVAANKKINGSNPCQISYSDGMLKDDGGVDEAVSADWRGQIDSWVSDLNESL